MRLHFLRLQVLFPAGSYSAINPNEPPPSGKSAQFKLSFCSCCSCQNCYPAGFCRWQMSLIQCCQGLGFYWRGFWRRDREMSMHSRFCFFFLLICLGWCRGHREFFGVCYRGKLCWGRIFLSFCTAFCVWNLLDT